ncbi:HEPN domain-containing protein [Microvirga sp. 2MCAF38]|uniref:HEPN domain-containing protein n=1 Tax=Microvirga sp. 2MCAF38 TaxID=3232989 RepID=UPI003F9AD5CC
MRSDLDPLPARVRLDLRRVLEVLFAEFDEALKGKLAPERKKGRILKVILYGSFARGEGVIDRVSGYVSDYDLLVVVNNDEFADFEYWQGAEDRFVQRALSAPLRPVPSLIVHSLHDVNEKLAHGRYFFMDILREGIALYEKSGHPFVKPQPLTPEAAREEAKGYFDYWFPLASQRFELAQEAISRGYLRDAAFDLHQSVERLYHCVLLVMTLHTPASHNIKHLRGLCEDLDRRLIAAWPRDTRLAQRHFEKLKRAYVDARHSPHYEITLEELAWLGERIAVLQNIVREICEERLKS